MSCNAKKDPNGTWRIQYRWTDWTGTKKKSQKRGFKTKKEAEEWYAHFMLQQSSDPTMTLADFWEIYKADMEKRLRKTTMKQNKALINNPDVKSANIIFIDSKLFENRTAIAGKFTGEEFKIILKKYFPFIEVIVITQNEIAPDYETISKYDPKCGKTPVEYYDEKLPLILDQCIRNIFEVRKITSELQKNTSWEKVMVEKIVNSVNGQGKFDEFTKNDIDDVIKMFQELQTKVEG